MRYKNDDDNRYRVRFMRATEEIMDRLRKQLHFQKSHERIIKFRVDFKRPWWSTDR